MHGLRRADAAEGGEDDGQEGPLLSDAPVEVLDVLLPGARGEEGGGIVGGGGGVGWDQRAGDGDVDGGDRGVGGEEGDDEVDLRAGPPNGAGEVLLDVEVRVEVGVRWVEAAWPMILARLSCRLMSRPVAPQESW